MAAPRHLGRTAVRLAGRLLGRLRPSEGVPQAGSARGRPARPGWTRPGTSRPWTAPTDEPDVTYRPRDDGRPDPGEIVWAWVPYDEGDGRGKDRPVLVIGRRGEQLLGLMLTSQDHDRDADEARHGRVWTDIGTGGWDARGRASEVRLDRLLVLDPASVRREGAVLDRARFERVVGEARRVQDW